MKLVSITIENMHNVKQKTYKFNNLTYFHGLNGVGKTTVLQAIQLALLGYIPGTDKKNEAIYRHASGTAMSVKAVLDDNGQSVTIVRSYVKTGTKITSSSSVIPEGYNISEIIGALEMPIFNFNQFMSMSANKLKDWFIDFIASGDDELDWNKLLSDGLKDSKYGDPIFLPKESDILTRVAKAASQHEGIESVRAVNAHLKLEQSGLKMRLEDTEGTLRSLVFYEDIDDSVTEEEIAELRNREQQLTLDRAKVIQYAEAKKHNDQMQSMLKSYSNLWDSLEVDENYIALQADLYRLNSYMPDLTSKKDELNSQIMELNAAIASASRFVESGGVCSYTKQPCEAIVSLIKTVKADIAKDRDRLAELVCEHNKISDKRSDVNQRISNINSEISKLSEQYRNKRFIETSIQPLDESYAFFDLDTIDTELAKVRDLIEKAVANLKYNQVVSSVTETKYRIEQDMLAVKRWIKMTDANHLQNDLMVKPFKQLANDMDAYVQKLFNYDWVKVDFLLSEKANSFSFGLIWDDSYVPFDLLSSGEKCLFTLALMLCLLDKSGTQLKLILIDDLLDHLDSTRISTLFESLKSIEDTQIVLAGVQKCTVKGSTKIVTEIK